MKVKSYKVVFTMLASFLILAQGSNAQTSEELKSYLPAISGWNIDAATEVFNPDNLFDRINGAAPLFIENNFREMTSMEYKKGDEYITIQAYRHVTPEDAFGMYASERSSDLAFFPIGGEAQGDDKSLYFFSGCIYVKMWTNSNDDVTDVLQEIGKGLAEKIDADADYPAIIKKFPTEGKVPYTEAYITSSYIGHEFLKSVYLANYQNSEGQSFQLFVVDGKTTEGAKAVLDAYFTFTKQSMDYQEGELTIKDRYNGDISIFWKGQYIIGIYNENGDTIAGAADYIKETAENLNAE